MNIVSLDLELTQNPGSTPKVIQIGAVKMNTVTGVVAGKFNVICNPGELPDAFITELTGITPDMVMEAVDLKYALESFWAWFVSQNVGWNIHQWGRGDLEALISASRELGVEYPYKVTSYNVKQFVVPFKRALGAPAKGGLGAALTCFGLPFVGRPHDAYDDAYNTGLLYVCLCQKIARWEKADKVLRGKA